MYTQKFFNDENLDISNLNVKSLQGFITDVKNGNFPAFSCVNSNADLAELNSLVMDIHNHFSHVVILGMGGSSLGAQTLVNFKRLVANTLVQFEFVDNVDPYRIDFLLETLPLEKTCVISISKSGYTIETVLQTEVFIEAFQNKKLAINKHVIGVYENGSNVLRRLLTKHNCQILEHDPKVGGRFSVFSMVGTLPALIAGLNIKGLRVGAAKVLNEFLENPESSLAYKGALVAVAAAKSGKKSNVIMPYGDRLKTLPLWFVQLWAESLGKNGHGSVPVAAVGSTDQHSALQNFLDGPNDFFFTVIYEKSANKGRKINCENTNLSLKTTTFGSLMEAQAKGTVDALSHRKHIVREMVIDELKEESLGALLMHYMLETVVAAHVWHLNAFDQPAVEEAKLRAMQYLDR